MSEAATLACVLDDLERRGYTERFRVLDGGLRALGTGAAVRAAALVIREYHRFEGVSDPDDLAIVYAVEADGGVRGTVVDAYGVYADPATARVLSGVAIAVLSESSPQNQLPNRKTATA